MPEIAEVHAFCQVVEDNQERVYTRITKSAVHKLEDVFPRWDRFRLRARARGKEAIVTVTRHGQKKAEQQFFLFKFGMTGSFRFVAAGDELDKHAHVVFSDPEGNSVCFVDSRRFGSWTVVEHAEDWGPDRGPDPIFDFGMFAKNVAAKVHPESKYWSKPICEVLLMQEVFNGIGNYLRAEILHELGLGNPFVQTRTVLADLTEDNCESHPLLVLCRDVPLRFMKSPKYAGSGGRTDEELFKVYSRSDSLSRKDSNGRTMWWKSLKSSSARDNSEEDEEDEEERKQQQKTKSNKKKKKKKQKQKKQKREVLELEEQLERIASSATKKRRKNSLARGDTEPVQIEKPKAKAAKSKKKEREEAKRINAKKKAQAAVKSQRRKKRAK